MPVSAHTHLPRVAVALCAFFLLAGCTSTNLTSQIGPVTADVAPYTNDAGQAQQELIVHFKNNGPTDVAAVSAKIEAYDAAGSKVESDSPSSYTIFASRSPAERIKAGQEYTTPPGHGYVFINAARLGTPVVRVNCTVTEAVAKNEIEAEAEKYGDK